MKALLIAILCATLGACSATKSLPHRQQWELFKQANSPSAYECPEGTRAMYVTLDEKDFFLECMR